MMMSPSLSRGIKLEYLLGGRIARGHHDPHGLRRLLQIVDQFLNGEGGHGAMLRRLARLVGRAVVGHDAMPAEQQALDHIAAHATKSNKSEFHANPLSM